MQTSGKKKESDLQTAKSRTILKTEIRQVFNLFLEPVGQEVGLLTNVKKTGGTIGPAKNYKQIFA